jgi:hypothetical protein
MEAFKRMSRTGRKRLMVVDKGRLLGVLALQDLVSYLSAKLELEGEDDISSRVRHSPETGTRRRLHDTEALPRV